MDVKTWCKKSVKFEWKHLISIPSIFAVIALIIYSLPFHNYPIFVISFFNYVGTPTTFLAMLLLGSLLYVERPDLKIHKKALIALLFFKMIILPVIVFFILKYLKFNPLATSVAVVISAMPPPSTSPILAANFGINPKFAGTATLGLTVAMLFTLPLILLLISIF